MRRRELTDQITRQREALGAAVAERTAALGELDELQRGDGAAREALAAAEATWARLEAEHASATEERARNLQALTEAVLASRRRRARRASAAERLERAQPPARRHGGGHDGGRRGGAGAAAGGRRSHRRARRLPVAARRRRGRGGRGRSRPGQLAGEPSPRRPRASPRRAGPTARGARRRRSGRSAAIAPSSSPPAPRRRRSSPLALADTWRPAPADPGPRRRRVRGGARSRAARRRGAPGGHRGRGRVQPAGADPGADQQGRGQHAAVLEAQDRTEGRFGGSRNRKRLDDARTEERRAARAARVLHLRRLHDELLELRVASRTARCSSPPAAPCRSPRPRSPRCLGPRIGAAEPSCSTGGSRLAAGGS
ncbi:MAG: hypothetical protein R2711_16495 [Acidimicrobiales bacterium]